MLRNRKPLERRTPLRRGKRLKPRRSTPRRSGRVRDERYLEWIRSRPCIVPTRFPAGWPTACDGVTEAHHCGPRAMGRKASDRDTVPVCTRHHFEYHACAGTFRMNKETRRVWARLAIEATQAAYEATQARGETAA